MMALEEGDNFLIPGVKTMVQKRNTDGVLERWSSKDRDVDGRGWRLAKQKVGRVGRGGWLTQA